MKDNIEISHLCFADFSSLLGNKHKEITAIKRIILKVCNDKVGLQISFENTEFIRTKLDLLKLETKYCKINKAAHLNT